MDKELNHRIRAADRLLRSLLDEAGDEFSPKDHDLLEKRVYEIRSVLTDELPPQIAVHEGDIHELLRKTFQIAHIWSVEDVMGVRPDLTKEQAWEVLDQVGRKVDSEYGISWTTLEIFADEMFPNGPTNRRQP
jgi:hypothetical protein